MTDLVTMHISQLPQGRWGAENLRKDFGYCITGMCNYFDFKIMNKKRNSLIL